VQVSVSCQTLDILMTPKCQQWLDVLSNWVCCLEVGTDLYCIPSVRNYKSLWLFSYIYFVMYLDIRYI
jgi:hypothetical protein